MPTKEVGIQTEGAFVPVMELMHAEEKFMKACCQRVNKEQEANKAWDYYWDLRTRIQKFTDEQLLKIDVFNADLDKTFTPAED